MMGFGMHSFWGFTYMFLFWGLIVIGIIYLVRNLNNNKDGRGNDNGQRDNAIQIARTRYARGEISKEEFKEILDDLND